MRVFRNLWRLQQGFTLLELLVAVVTGMVAMTALIQFFSFQVNSMKTENMRRSAQMTARNALNFITRQLEHVGRDPQQFLFSPTAPAIRFGTSTDKIVYEANLSTAQEDLDTTDDWEQVTFEYADGVILATDGEGEPNPLTDETGQRSYIPANGLTFTFFDGNGAVVTALETAAARATIRRINVSITVIGGPDDGDADDQPQVTISQDVFLRNVS
jgi:prepilin-type N-terminal cleavage/methylation domain-containing protein